MFHSASRRMVRYAPHRQRIPLPPSPCNSGNFKDATSGFQPTSSADAARFGLRTFPRCSRTFASCSQLVRILLVNVRKPVRIKRARFSQLFALVRTKNKNSGRRHSFISSLPDFPIPSPVVGTALFTQRMLTFMRKCLISHLISLNASLFSRARPLPQKFSAWCGMTPFRIHPAMKLTLRKLVLAAESAAPEPLKLSRRWRILRI